MLGLETYSGRVLLFAFCIFFIFFFMKVACKILCVRFSPLVAWLTTRDGRLISYSRKSKKILGNITPQSLYKHVRREDVFMSKYLEKMPNLGVSREAGITLKNKKKFRVFQLAYGKNFVLWVFHKRVNFRSSAPVHKKTLLLNKNPEHTIQEAPMGIMLMDRKARILDSNYTMQSWFNKNPPFKLGVHKKGDNLFQKVFQGIHQEIVDKFLEDLKHNRVSALKGKRYIANLSTQDEKPVALWGHKVPLADNKDLYVVYCQDISWEKNIEKQFTHAQRMQALGQLSGSIAHDFNNILTGIVGFSDILLSKYSPGQQAYSEVMQIKQNAYRGANLVKQLMSFSKHQSTDKILVNITDLIMNLTPLFKRLLGNNIILNLNLGRSLGCITVDPSQFEQILMNLIVNARDAILNSGTVNIITKNRKAEDIFWYKGEKVESGSYVQLEVEDTGSGISEEKLEKVFDPFYTSKEEGRTVGSGAGLGLATVYNIVQQAQGYIFVESKEGEGTKFTVLWPQTENTKGADIEYKPFDRDEENERVHYQNLLASSFSMDEKNIFLVEDDEMVCHFTEKALRKKGYKVESFSAATMVLEYLKNNPKSKIDLLITDVVMPKVSGTELACELYKKFPFMEIIFISGYSDVSFSDLPIQKDRILFLQKPYDLTTLVIKVHEKLSRSLIDKKEQ